MSKEKNNLPRNLMVTSIILLFLQNFIVFISSITDLEDDEYIFNSLNDVYDAEFQWMIDILGFAIFAIAFYLKANNNADNAKKYQLIAAGFGAWVILRILWQHILMPDIEAQLLGSIEGNSTDEITLDGSVTVFLITSVVLLYVGIMLFSVNKNNILFLIYSVLNIISSFFIFLSWHTSTEDLWNDLVDSLGEDFLEFLTYQLKLIIIPLLALPALYKMGEDDLKSFANDLN